MVKPQIFSSSMPEISPANTLLTSQSIQNATECRKFMMQCTVLLTQGDENNPPPQRSYSTPCAAVHSIYLQQNINQNH